MKPVIIADLQDITKAGLLFFLGTNKEFGIIDEAFTKKELLTQLATSKNAIILLDFTLFDFSGPEDLLNVSTRFKDTYWILFSEELSTDFLRSFLYNASNFSVIFKDSSKDEIQNALTLALKNERFICNRASNQLLGKHTQQIEKQENKLTASELEIIRLIAMGKTNKEIATERFSSVHTITTHRKNIFRKLNVNSVHEATKYALRAGILDSAEYYI
jgi:two-component system, NarL family, response regulator LiaR